MSRGIGRMAGGSPWAPPHHQSPPALACRPRTPALVPQLTPAARRHPGKGGKTKFAIENATRTRIVIADEHIRILGSFQNIKIARDAICALIMGSPPGKVYSRLRIITSRLAEKF